MLHLTLSLIFLLCFIYYISCLISRFCVSYVLCLALSLTNHILYVASLPYVLCIMFFSLSFALFLKLFFALFLVKFFFSFGYNQFTHFAFYIVSFDKQLYVELATNQWRCYIWCNQMSCTLCLCFVSYILCLLLCFLPYFLSSFRFPLGAIDLLVFLSIL